VREILSNDDTDALLRHLKRELDAVAAEAVLGHVVAARIPPSRQEEVSRLERPVQEALGALLTKEEGPIHDAAAFGRLLARAIGMAGGAVAGGEPRNVLAPRSLSSLLKTLCRELQRVDDLLERIQLALAASGESAAREAGGTEKVEERAESGVASCVVSSTDEETAGQELPGPRVVHPLFEAVLGLRKTIGDLLPRIPTSLRTPLLL